MLLRDVLPYSCSLKHVLRMRSLTGALQVVAIGIDSLRPLQRDPHSVISKVMSETFNDNKQRPWLLFLWRHFHHRRMRPVGLFVNTNSVPSIAWQEDALLLAPPPVSLAWMASQNDFRVLYWAGAGVHVWGVVCFSPG